MLPTVRHSGQVFTATKVVRRHWYRGRVIKVMWPLEELYARRPSICKKARQRYLVSAPKGFWEGTAAKNCNCNPCIKAWEK